MNKLKVNLSLLNIKRQEHIILGVFIASLLLYALFILYGDSKKISDAAMHFKWGLIPFLLVLTLCNYIVRAFRFYLYLKEIGIHMSFPQAFAVFMSGLSMTVTPGKSGEIIKAYFIKKSHGNRFSEVIPILVTERLTDGIAMIFLALAGIFLVKNSFLFFTFAVIFTFGFIIAMRLQRYIMNFVFFLEKKFPRFKLIEFFAVFFHNAQKLLTFRNLSIGIWLGMIAWAFEGYSLYVIVHEFLPVDFLRGVAISFFIFSFSSIAGFFVFIPGGIGVAEGSISYFLTQFFTMPVATAIFTTLLFRFITLWFGVLLGLSFLIRYLHTHFKAIDKEGIPK